MELAADSPTPGSQPSAPVTPAALDAVPAPAAVDDVAVDDLEKELELDLENMQLDENIDTSVRTGRNRPEPDWASSHWHVAASVFLDLLKK